MSFDSGRDVDGSVEGGEKMSSAAGVFGGRESRMISAVGTGSGIPSGGTTGCKLRVMVSRLRAFFTNGFLSGLSVVEERCFLGDMIGSVFTGSRSS